MSPKTEIRKEDKEDKEESEMMRQVFSDFRDFFPEDKSEIDAMFVGEPKDPFRVENPLEREPDNTKAIIRKTVVYCNRIDHDTEEKCVSKLEAMYALLFPKNAPNTSPNTSPKTVIQTALLALVDPVGSSGGKKRRPSKKGGTLTEEQKEQQSIINYAIECIKFFYRGDGSAAI